MPDDQPCWRCADRVPPGYYCPICGRVADDPPPPEHLTESTRVPVDAPNIDTNRDPVRLGDVLAETRRKQTEAGR